MSKEGTPRPIVASDGIDGTQPAPLSSYLVRTLRHELVQPLHSLNLMIDLAPIGGSDTEMTAWVARIDKALDGMKRMIASLGESCRLEIDPPPRSMVDQALAPILAAALEPYREAAQHAGLAIELPSVDRTVTTDKALLRLGLARLIDNAVRHSEAKTLAVEIDKKGREYLISVRDDGIGLEPEDAQRCLAPLGTGSVARIKGTAGLGMGLTAAQHVARLLGGRFHFESKAGKGTTAGFFLPAGV